MERELPCESGTGQSPAGGSGTAEAGMGSGTGDAGVS